MTPSAVSHAHRVRHYAHRMRACVRVFIVINPWALELHASGLHSTCSNNGFRRRHSLVLIHIAGSLYDPDPDSYHGVFEWHFSGLKLEMGYNGFFSRSYAVKTIQGRGCRRHSGPARLSYFARVISGADEVLVGRFNTQRSFAHKQTPCHIRSHSLDNPSEVEKCTIQKKKAICTSKKV